MGNLTPTEKALQVNEIISLLKSGVKQKRAKSKAALDKIEDINMLKELGLSEVDL